MNNKKLTLINIVILLLSCTFLFSQVPQSMKYQAVARSADGNLITDQMVSMKISILQSSFDGQTVYSESHNIMSNSFGIIYLEVGTGSSISGQFDEIKWGEDDYFIQLEMDPSGGSNYQLMGSSQLLSVPYALFSGNGVQFDPSLECNESNEGTLRYDYESKNLELCNGSEWSSLGESTGSFDCGQMLVDPRDGKTYTTIAIGTQCWMSQNLDFGTYKESVFTNEDHSDVSNNGVVEKYVLDNDEGNAVTYGGLYDWNEMMNYSLTEGSQGICPDGWHVPTYDEFLELIDQVGGSLIAGRELKLGGSSGFNFPLGGSRLAKGGFSGETVGGIWTSTPSASHPTSRASVFNFIEAGDNIQTNTDVMFVGKSVRCIKN